MSEQEPDATPTTTDPVRFLDAENDLVGELTAAIGSQRQALTTDRVCPARRGTTAATRAPPVSRPGPAEGSGVSRRGSARPIERRSRTDHRRLAGGACPSTTSFADAWDAGVMLGLAAVLVADRRGHRGPVRPPGRADPRRQQPGAAGGAGAGSDRSRGRSGVGTSPICGPRGGVSAFKAYSIIDIYSRKTRRLPCRGPRGRRPRRRDVRRRVRPARSTRRRARRLRSGDALHRPEGPARRSRCHADPQPAAGLQRQPVLANRSSAP